MAIQAGKAAVLFIFAAGFVWAQEPAQTSGTPVPQTQNASRTKPSPDHLTPDDNNAGAQPQTAAPPPITPTSTSPTAAANIVMRATLDTPLSTKTSKPGDRFTATIAEAVQGGSQVIIPAGTRLEGEVGEPEQGKESPALRGKGKLDLRFRDVVLPSGQTISLAASLVSVNKTNGTSKLLADKEGHIESGTQGKDVAKDAGEAPSGGPIFEGPVKGLAIGELAGGGYVLAISANSVNLPAQTGLVIRLNQPLKAE